MTHKSKISLYIPIMIALALSTAATPVFARSARADEVTAENSTKLAEKQLRACQKREASINKRLSKISSNSEKQLEVFDKIFERVQEFKEDKNYTVENYEQLVLDVKEKQSSAKEIIKNISTTSDKFSCEADNPKGISSQFKEQLAAKNSALKYYKTALKDFIVAVKSSKSQGDKTVEKSTDDNQNTEQTEGE